MNTLLQAPQEDLHPNDDRARGVGGSGMRASGSGSGTEIGSALHLTVSITV